MFSAVNSPRLNVADWVRERTSLMMGNDGGGVSGFRQALTLKRVGCISHWRLHDLRHLFEELHKASTAEALEAALPWNVKSAL